MKSEAVASLLEDMYASPTPYHAAHRAADLLDGASFRQCAADQALPSEPGAYYVRHGGMLIAWLLDASHSGFTIVGAHTDSPNLRIKPRPAKTSAGFVQLGVETYGGVLLNSWLDRDLGIAGRVALGGEGNLEQRLLRIDEAILRVPQLAIHLDREITPNGLKLNPQRHMVPIWGLADSDADSADQEPDGDEFRQMLADVLDVDTERILGYDLMAYDLQEPSFVGRDRTMVASARIDNLVSTFCGVHAMVAMANSGDVGRRCPVLVLYDHEEVGSESATGASGAALAAMVERIAYARGEDRSTFLASLNQSIAISADGAHATHPNYADRHDQEHLIALNAGVVVKRNANVRYATDASSEAFAVAVAQEAGQPLQFYSHRNDLPCGSTIGPMLSARLAISTVDLGAPQLAMHSIRETAGASDIAALASLLEAAWHSSLAVSEVS